tara:strand:- start:445 stop:1191 length:747 start_codon:yes stop_codon:yes gene_type:complete
MYLLGDIGNTEIKICLYETNFILKKKLTLKTNLINKKYLLKKLFFLKKKKYKIDKIIFSSVVPQVFLLIKNFLEKITNVKCLELKELDLRKLIKIKVNKIQVGSDRLANAIGVIDNKNNYIVLDFGTATTFDVIVKNKYLGGVIAPGVNLSLNNLSYKASLIPNINLLKVSTVIGKDTVSAVRSGFYWGYNGLIENIINLIFKQTKKSYKIILTGGLAHLFKNSIKKKTKIKKDLTIIGILKIIKKIK